MDDVLSSGKLYAGYLLQKWTEIGELSEKFRTNLMLQDADHIVTYQYISQLTRLWGELYPKIAGRNDLSELVAEFEHFSPYYYDPSQLAQPDKSEEIFKLEYVLRMVLEKLGITKYEE